MSATQRSGRRSLRSAFGEEDAPPPKRTKMDDASKTKAANGRKATMTTKKAKAAYEEDEDGFQFSRAPKQKKTSSKQTATVAQIPDEQSTEETPPIQPTIKRGRPRKTVPNTLPQEAELNRSASPEKKRRSERLSGGHDPQKEDSQTIQLSNGGNRTEHRVHVKTPASTKIHVEKKRGVPTKIALPFADTPVIQRNKEMRKTSAEGRRRSSSGMRGRRASSLIDNGTSNAMPHSEVESSEFYKHIHQDLPEPRRMKQLLIWCGTRALPPRPTGTIEDVTAVLTTRTIQEEMLRDFSNRNEMSDWFNREDIAPTALVKKPNPRNVQNAEKLLELEQEVERLTAESATWEIVLGSLSKATEKRPQVDFDPAQVPGPGNIDAKLLADPQQASIHSDFRARDGQSELLRTRLKAAIDSFEFKMDTFADGVHKLEKFKETADATVGGILSRAAALLEEKERASSVSAGTEKIGVGDLLRSFSRTA